MYEEISNKSLNEYRMHEASLHRDLMNCCRRYINELGIVSVLGILEIVKQETTELEHATKKNIEKHGSEEINKVVDKL